MPENVKIQLRRGTDDQWSSVDPVLSSGEPCFNTDTGAFKIGDGVSKFSELVDYRNGKFSNVITVSKNDKFADFNCADAVYGGDDAACIQAAINSLTLGGAIWVFDGNYGIGTQLTAKNKIAIYGIGEVIFTSTITNGFIFSTGTPNYSLSTIPLSSDAISGATTISLSSIGGLAADDWIKIIDDSYIELQGTNYKNGEIVRIVSITDTILTIDHPLYDTYTTISNANIRKIFLFENLKFSNIHFIGAGIETSSCAMQIRGAYNLKIEDCTFREFGERAVSLCDTLESTISKCIFKNNQFTGLGYSIAIGNASDNIHIDKCDFKENGRHYIAIVTVTTSPLTGGFARGVHITDCNFENSNQEAINFHATNKCNAIISNCKFLECAKGVEFNNVPRAIVNSCEFISCNGPVACYRSPEVFLTSNIFDNFENIYTESNTVISGNLFLNAGYIYILNATSKTIDISDNVFRAYSNLGIYAPETDTPKIIIKGNIYHGNKNSTFIKTTYKTGIEIVDNTAEGEIELWVCADVKCLRNTIDTTTPGIRVHNAAGTHHLVGNDIKTTSYPISLTASGTNTNSIVIRRNTLTAATPVYNQSSYYSAVDDDGVRI